MQVRVCLWQIPWNGKGKRPHTMWMFEYRKVSCLYILIELSSPRKSKYRCNVVMYCMNALRWMHVICGLTNDWNGELMIILELFRRLLWMQDSHDQLAARNALWKSKVVWMIRLWSKEYLNLSSNCMNAVTIPCNVSMIMIAWRKWALIILMWLTAGSIWIL